MKIGNRDSNSVRTIFYKTPPQRGEKHQAQRNDSNDEEVLMVSGLVGTE